MFPSHPDAHLEFLYWFFWHNNHEVQIGPLPNKYEAATEFRNQYGYWPNLDTVSSATSPKD